MANPYAFTKAHYFKSKLDLSYSDFQEDKKQKEKLINQFKQFNLKYTEISLRLDIKNFISFNYIRNQLIKLNKTYPNFTAEQIEVIIDLEITNDILEALEKKIIAGAGLDVYDIEPLPENHKLRFLPNALLLPHLGYVTKENYEIFYTQMAENLKAFKEGKPIRVIQMLN